MATVNRKRRLLDFHQYINSDFNCLHVLHWGLQGDLRPAVGTKKWRRVTLAEPRSADEAARN